MADLILFPETGPHIFGMAPGTDFAKLLVQELQDRLAGHPPEAMARVTLYLNTQRMRRRVTDLFVERGAGFLPRMKLVTEPGHFLDQVGIPDAIPPLRRRLILSQLIAGLLDSAPDMAPRAAIFDLADSLANLLDEMQGEGVSPNQIASLDVSDHSAHWQRTKEFLGIIAPFFFDNDAPDSSARLRLLIDRLSHGWRKTPPKDPVIIAGSTGSRGTTAALMRVVAGLPQGALILPGFDFDLPSSVWDSMNDALTAEDHPQFRFRRLLSDLGLTHADVLPLGLDQTPSKARNKLVSLSLRPAPVTDQWLFEGKSLGDLDVATQDMTLIEAPSARAEALSIALILREAAERGETAALITPDRMLTRRVTSALDRWGILPDDSAGRPLALSPPGRLLRHVAALFGQRLTSETLLVLLKHPLTASGSARGPHLLLTRELELHLRQYGPPFPDQRFLVEWGKAQKTDGAEKWATWLADTLADIENGDDQPLADHVTRHIRLTETLALGADPAGASELWEKQAGQDAKTIVQTLKDEAKHGGTLSVSDYRALFESTLSTGEVREDVQAHPGVMIWGTLEARVMGPTLLILGGLNEGVWPKMPPPDPWLNRRMRKDAGLLLPERQIGLSAHDYQQAVCAPKVVLTRAHRDEEAETVTSRWVNRLTNLLQGLPDQNGHNALKAMKARGNRWLDLAEQLELPTQTIPPGRRPAPRPPVAVRPKVLAVTGISRLIRDPYAIYARSILRLFKLDPLHQSPDARERGTVVHKILENYARIRRPDAPLEDEKSVFLEISRETINELVPWPTARALWHARMERVADFFLSIDRAEGGTPVILEQEGKVRLTELDFTLIARPDRIDMLADGQLHILDYKTSTPPTKPEQKYYEKQLLLEAAMAERAGFPDLGPREVAKVSYVGLGSAPKVVAASPSAAELAEVWEGLHSLIRSYQNAEQGYAARRAPKNVGFSGDYDHLARFGEWDQTAPPSPEDVG
jgi:ATP-dependent helicase/nuclease subunit B